MMQSGENTGGPDEMKLPPVVNRIENQTPDHKAPICVLMVGMAGSGKTTLLGQLQRSTFPEMNEEEEVEDEIGAETSSTEQAKANVAMDQKVPAENQQQEDCVEPPAQPKQKMPAYCINLDPATIHIPYNASIDIRDTVDYKVCSDKKE